MTTSESTEVPAPDGAPIRRRPTPEAVADVVVTVLLLGLFGWAFLETAEWSLRAALFPRMVTATAVVLAALHLVQAVLRLRRASPPLDEAHPDDVEYVFRTAGPHRWASALAWVAAFFVLLYVTGLYVTAPVFSLLYLRVAAKRTLIFSAIYAIVMGVLLYVAFELALGVPTPSGLLVE
jgi:Tripartite tricarboxylate transporter TctB family